MHTIMQHTKIKSHGEPWDFLIMVFILPRVKLVAKAGWNRWGFLGELQA